MTAMTERPAAFRLVALLLLVLAAGGLACVAAALSALFLSSAPLHTDTIFALTGVGPTIVGAVLVVRRPGNMVGRLLVLIGSTWSLGEAGRVYLWVQVHAGPLPVTDLAAWFVSWAFAPAWLLVLFLLPVFPHGRVASSWMRWPVRVAIPAVLTLTLLGMFLPDELEAYGTYLIGVTNPWAIVSQPDSPVIDVLEMGPIGPLAILAALGPLDLIRRWRKSEGVERLQMRSLALGVLVTVLLLIAGAFSLLLASLRYSRI